MGGHIRRPARVRSFVYGTIGVIGELLITAAVILALFAFWQAFWTSYEVEAPRAAVIAQFEEEHAPASTGEGVIETSEPPPAPTNLANAEVYGLIHFPKWDWMKTPLAQGVGADVLDMGWAGHYPDTAQPGEIGNFSVAGHRRSYGNNFRRVEEMQVGDEIVVDLQDHYLVYEVDNWEIVSATDPENYRVIAPVPGDVTLSQTPTERWMTMTTCHPEWGNTERYIVHLKYKYWMSKSTGKPAVLLEEPES
ncbi:class E sortase [Schaalia suimastitidis]|uniref:class E sortase n=1 Tax=Schaalia suimastitidis TaxID=121163 RepID=UPI000478C92D|nr:class E sortase [Schaalia suimastitidis]